MNHADHFNSTSDTCDIDIDDIGDVTDSIFKNITTKNVSHILRDTVAINRLVLGRETSQGLLTLTPLFFGDVPNDIPEIWYVLIQKKIGTDTDTPT